MKIGLFTDSHYCSKDKYRDSLEKLDRALCYFVKNECSLAVFLGDLVDKEETHDEEIASLKEVRRVMDKYALKIYVVIGNHDNLNFSKKEFYEILGEERRPENVCINGKNLLFIDACHYKNGEDYLPNVRDWSVAYFPYTDKLSNDLRTLCGEASYIFTHHPLDPAVIERHRVTNADEIINILEKDKKVTAVFQGHDHQYIESDINGIHYITYPSLLEQGDAYYTFDI